MRSLAISSVVVGTPLDFIFASNRCAGMEPFADAIHARIPRTMASVVRIDIRNASASTMALVTSRLRLKRIRMLFQAISIALESGSVICRCACAVIRSPTSELSLENTLAHEHQTQAEHHNQPHAATVSGEEDDDVQPPLLAELFLEVVSS